MKKKPTTYLYVINEKTKQCGLPLASSRRGHQPSSVKNLYYPFLSTSSKRSNSELSLIGPSYSGPQLPRGSISRMGWVPAVRPSSSSTNGSTTLRMTHVNASHLPLLYADLLAMFVFANTFSSMEHSLLLVASQVSQRSKSIPNKIWRHPPSRVAIELAR